MMILDSGLLFLGHPVYECPPWRRICWIFRVGGRCWLRQWVEYLILLKSVWSALWAMCLNHNKCSW